MREIIVDTETTGLNYKAGDRIIELACVELYNHVRTGKNLQFYCSTNKTISEGAYKVTNLSKSFLSKFPTFSKQANKFIDFIKKDTLVIHNAVFDIGFINNELKIAGQNMIKNKVVDTVQLARKTLNTRIANLDYLCKRFSIDLSKRRIHGALLDCELLSEVYLELLGGKQTALKLGIFQEKETINKKNKPKEAIKFHKTQNLEEDILKHKNFIADLKNALWHKVDY